MLCDVVCAIACAVGCFLRFSRGGMASVQWVAGWGPPQLQNEQACAHVQLSLEHLPWLKLRQISFPLQRGAVLLGQPGRRALLAGLLEYKEHSDLLYGMQIDRGSRKHLLLFSWLQ